MLRPKTGTAQWKRLTKSVFYGIDPKTFEVKRITLTNDNVLHYYGDQGTYSHAVLSGRMARSEVVIVWGLTDLLEIFPGSEGDEFTKRQVSELNELAAKKKAEIADRN